MPPKNPHSSSSSCCSTPPPSPPASTGGEHGVFGRARFSFLPLISTLWISSCGDGSGTPGPVSSDDGRRRRPPGREGGGEGVGG